MCCRRIRAQKPQLLELLQSGAERPDLAEGNDLAANAEILETREALIAVRIRSRSLDREVWLARNERAAAELQAEMAPGHELPVLLFEEIPLLKGKSQAMCRAILDTKAVFPDSRILQ